MNVADVKSLADEIRYEVARAIVGQDEAVELMLIALFSSGHVLLEGPPGTAKTFLAQCFARVLGLDFGRVQFTPDLMPGDILGSNLFNFQTSQFTLTRGPIFCDLLLADEINRTPPKTQAALLEAMQERAVTIDGETHKLGDRFMVIATQNPIEQQGVYPLPEAQLDRFLFKHVMGYPSAEEERKIVTNYGARFGSPKPGDWGIEQKVGAGRLAEALAAVATVPMVGEVVDYVVSLVRATREAPDLQGGASPRAAAMLAAAARARAALQGRDYVIPDDVKALAPAVLRHRVMLSAAAEIEGRPVESIVARLIDEVGGAALIYPTRLAILLTAAVAPIALLLGLFLPQFWTSGLALIVLLVAAALADAALGVGAREAEVACEGPGAVSVTETFGVVVQVKFAGAAPSPLQVAIGVSGPVSAPMGWRAEAEVAGRSGEAAIVLRAERRGTATLDDIWVRWKGPFGLVWKQRQLDLDQSILISPDIRPVRDKAPQLINRDALHGLIAQMQVGEGAEFEALADYRQGMDRRAIDWKTSARHTHLVAKEYRTERNNNIVMAIDAGRAMCEPLDGVPRVDRAVSAALLTAFVALKDGDRVGLFSFDSKPRASSKPISGARAFATLQRVAAGIDYSDNETNYTLGLTTLASTLNRRSLIVVFTEFADTISAELMLEALRPLLKRHLVVFVVLRDEELEAFTAAEPVEPDDVSRAVMAATLLRERLLVLTRLRHMDAHVIEASGAEAGPALVRAYLDLKRRSLI